MSELTGKHFLVDLCLLKVVTCSVNKCLESLQFFVTYDSNIYIAICRLKSKNLFPLAFLFAVQQIIPCKKHF